MEVVIEFHRTRLKDGAHALLARVNCIVSDLEEALELARSINTTLEMPQQPDAVTIKNAVGNILRSVSLARPWTSRTMDQSQP